MLEIVQATSLVINAIVLLILVIKHIQDIGHQRLSIENLKLGIERNRKELESLQTRTAAEGKQVVAATPEDLRRYVLQPLADSIERASAQVIETEHRLMAERRRIMEVEHADFREARADLREAAHGLELLKKLKELLEQRDLGSPKSAPEPVVPTEAIAAETCVACGAKLASGALFCGSCGERIARSGEKTPAPTNPPSADSDRQPNQALHPSAGGLR